MKNGQQGSGQFHVPLLTTLAPLSRSGRTKSISRHAPKVHLKSTFLSDIKHQLYFTKHKRKHTKSPLLFSSLPFNSV